MGKELGEGCSMGEKLDHERFMEELYKRESRGDSSKSYKGYKFHFASCSWPDTDACLTFLDGIDVLLTQYTRTVQGRSRFRWLEIKL